MENAEKLLENPVIRVAAATGLLLVALQGVLGLLFGVVDALGVFERLVFDSLWNLTQGEWFAIFVVLVAWIALGSMMNLDAGLLGGAAAVFAFMAVIMNNVRRDLPEVLEDFYQLLPPALLVLAAAVGLVALRSSSVDSTLGATAPAGVQGLYGRATSNLGLGGGARAPMGLPTQAPAPTTAPEPVPAPVSKQPEGWLPDPKGEAQLRYWDGSAWTEHTHNG